MAKKTGKRLGVPLGVWISLIIGLLGSGMVWLLVRRGRRRATARRQQGLDGTPATAQVPDREEQPDEMGVVQ